MPDHIPDRRAKQARLAAALNELGHALLAIYPDTDRAVLVVSRPEPHTDLTLPIVVREAGVPLPADNRSLTPGKRKAK
jgi:hypothetical protein